MHRLAKIFLYGLAGVLLIAFIGQVTSHQVAQAQAPQSQPRCVVVEHVNSEGSIRAVIVKDTRYGDLYLLNTSGGIVLLREK